LAAGEPTPSITPGAGVTKPARSSAVEVTKVGFAADSAYIMVEFKAPASVVRGWIQGLVYVVDEASGIKYEEIPVMPTIGPLISRPKEDGRPGFVMLVNTDASLKPGAVVTVVLGDFKQEHLVVQ
jgi:hypothetical protein